MKRIALITNFNIPEKATAAMQVANVLLQYDCELMVASFNRERIARQKLRPQVTYLPVDDLYAKADLVIVLGGDGSILEAARRSAKRETPILGINLGRLGYMAELEMSELSMLSRLFDDSYELEERSMLLVRILGSDRTERFSSYALNEAVITNGSVARIIDLELSEGGVPVTTYRADGLIVATPTGSTAYSLSAGGPIADPRLHCFCVTPICPHSLSVRPLIFPDEAVLEIKNVCQREKSLFLTVDGRVNYELYRGNIVEVRRSASATRLVRFRKCGFYNRLREKMADVK